MAHSSMSNQPNYETETPRRVKRRGREGLAEKPDVIETVIRIATARQPGPVVSEGLTGGAT